VELARPIIWGSLSQAAILNPPAAGKRSSPEDTLNFPSLEAINSHVVDDSFCF
jgi:hypothetical protein